MLLPCLADVVAIFVADVIATIDVGRCYCHVWLMLLPFLWLMLLPLLLLADVVAIFWLMLLPLFCLLMVPCLADVIAIMWLMLLPLLLLADVVAMFGWCYCHCFCLLMAPVVLLWLLLCHIVGVLYFSGRSYCQVWLMFLPFVAVWQMLLPIWLMLLPLYLVVLGRCCLPGWQME